MTEQEIRGLVDDVNAGRLSRRAFVRTMIGVGLTAPLASQMLAASGVAHAQAPAFTPTKRGGGGALKVMGPPDPGLLMRVFSSGEIASKENKWQKFSVFRWRNDEYDRLYRSAETEMDPVKRAALFIRMNDLVLQHGVVIPIALRAKASAMSSKLRGAETNPYEVDFWSIAYWYREA